MRARRAVVIRPEIFPLRLEPREVVAYRRLSRRTASSDRELEQFLLEAAALRMRINEEAQEITGILDETSVTGDAPIFGRARLTARRGRRATSGASTTCWTRPCSAAATSPRAGRSSSCACA